jgi:protein-disulfide isomerase
MGTTIDPTKTQDGKSFPPLHPWRGGQGVRLPRSRNTDRAGLPPSPTLLRTLSAFLLLLPLLFTTQAQAQCNACAQLTPEQKAIADPLMAEVFPHDCCDDTLARCLEQPKPSRLVKRLAADVCRRVIAKEAPKDIQRALERRAASMIAVGKPAEIDLEGVTWAGDAQAPVTLAVYACARCPFCSKSVPTLHAAITKGPLTGKVRMAFKVFPIRSHEHSAEGGLAMQAARMMGKEWPYILKLYTDFDGFSLEKLVAWAGELGMDPARFTALTQDKAQRKKVVAAKKEGLRNHVEATPTYFINGRKYTGDLKEVNLVDALEEEHERVKGVLCEGVE